MSGVVWLASLLVLPAAGAPLLLHSAYRRFGAFARVALAFAVGAGALSLVMTVAALAGWRWHPAPLALSAFALCAVLRLAIRRPSPLEAPPPSGGPLAASEWVAIGIILVALAAAAAAAFSAAATSPDLILFWGPKGETFAAAGGFDADYLGDPVHVYQHVSYPPLVPAMYAFATMAAGRFSWMGAVATFPLCLAALALALPGVLGRFASRRDALAATAAITAAIGFLGDALDVAGNADSALLLFEVLAVAVLLGTTQEDGAGELLAGILLGGAVAAKVEGLPFALTAIGSYFILRRARGAASLARSAARLVLPSAAVLAAWLAFGTSRHLFRGYESYGPAFSLYLRTLGPVLAGIARALFHAGGALPWLIPLAAVLACGSAAWRGQAPYPLAIAAVLVGFFVFTYLHVPDPALWIEWSAGRIFMVVSPLCVLAVVAARAQRREPAATNGRTDA